MAQANGYMNNNNLTLGNSKLDLNDFYHQQDQGSFDYIAASHPLIQDMDSLMYTQQHGTNDKTGVVTATSGTSFLVQNEQAVYTTTNSDTVGLCTASGQNTLSTTNDSSSSTMGTDTSTMVMTTSNSATTASTSSPPSSTWTPSTSPLSTSSTSMTCMNAPLLLPVSSSIGSSFLSSSLSHSLSMDNNGDVIKYTSSENINTQHQPLDTHHSPMPTTFYHQDHSIPINTLSPTFMPPSHRPSLTSAASPRATTSPTMTMSASAPTAMTSNIGIQTSPSGTQHSMDFKVPRPPTQSNKKDQDTPPTNSRSQSSLSATANTELRRQIHIQSEQKRRAQIKDGFEDLRNELPSCLNKKMSKVALLQRTVQHIQHLKSTQITILGELERLMNENEHLKKFQENAIQNPGSVKSYHNLSSM